MHVCLSELKALVPDDYIKSRKSNQPVKNEEVNQVKEGNKIDHVEVINKQVKENKVNNDDVNVKTESTKQKDKKTDNEDEENVKIDVTSCSPGCVELLIFK